MPYKAFPEGDQYCVYKLNANDRKTGKSLGCHPSLQLANRQVAALYAAEGKEMSDKAEVKEKENLETKMYGEMKYTPAASFAELQAMEQAKEVEEMAEYFPMMVGNIINRPDIEDKNEALRQLSIEFVGIVNEKITAKEITKETEQPTQTKEDHYKAVQADDTLADSDDFQGGCPYCEFGEPELMKELEKCPYCWAALEATENE